MKTTAMHLRIWMCISAFPTILALPLLSQAQDKAQETTPTTPPSGSPLLSPSSQLSALVTVVPTASDTKEVGRTLTTIEAAAFFAGKIGARPIKADETVYLLARPFPRKEARSSANEPFAFYQDEATKELSLLGGFFQRAALRGQDENTLLLNQTKELGKPRTEKDDDGNAVLVTPVTTTDWLVNLNGLTDFDARLYQRQTQRILVRFNRANATATDARKLARSMQIVLGVRRVGEPKRGTVIGPPSNPRDPQADANTQATLTQDATLTDIFVVEAATKRVLTHFVPKPDKEEAPAD